jgi:aryl-alcohol dehydrogenase-like predicted oxidoreductase
MKFRQLGNTDVKVSNLALGTMTWGEQNTEADAHSQLDLAIDYGVNLIDAAEMYPVPPKPETYGLAEQYLGSWLKNSGKRHKLVIATKAAGPARLPYQPRHIRGGLSHFNRSGLTEALHGSLERLQTDYIDLYQLHWPDRSVNNFGELNYTHPAKEETVPVGETLSVLAEFVRAGKIRHIGISNETPWGVAQFLREAEKFNLPKVVSIQNPYNLLNRTFEIALSEFAFRDQVGLLAYSPLGFGVLSGKYLNGAHPPDARISLYEHFARYTNVQAERATREYVALARKHALDPVQLALAYINSRPFVTSTIVGASTLAQLKVNLGSIHLTLNEKILSEIESIHTRQPNPAP